MNLSSVGHIPDMSSISAILFAPNAAIATSANMLWLSETLGGQGGVRQDPPSGSHVVRREVGIESEPTIPPDDVDDEPDPSEEE